ncbi:coiled-coil domain-containing protein 112 isoform X2 [Cynoglossus semilaevis]|uniref:coiled-coil domain-containing protein 112 isoform X2 n=1 Tax=Cynoglossus semilaevis TaxID=244447 RepID=UPI000D62A0C6|nr:coiled-coil domain-containing protein 112 isoform X2 [Cynoglossus semilaevis]
MASLATPRPADKQSSEEARDCIRVQLSCTASSGSSDAVKAAEFLREAEKTRRQIETLEKQRTLSFQCRKNGRIDISRELEEFERVIEENRNAEKMTLQKQLLKIHHSVRKFQGQLVDVKSTSKLIERLTEIMSEVESSINNLKEEQRSCFEALQKEETICRQEVKAYEKKIENWSMPLKSEPKLAAAPTVKTKLLDSNLPADVRPLECFLQKSGGACGGWDQYDHQTYIKIWTKYSGQPAYRKEAKLYLPGKTLEEIEQHEEWHHELIYLQDKKRDAIQRWKASKYQESQMGIQSQEKSERREKEAKTLVQRQRIEEEKRERAHRLDEWREKKRRKDKEEEEQRVADEIMKRRLAKVSTVDTCEWQFKYLINYIIPLIFYQEECRRQVEVKLIIEQQLRLKREEEAEQESWRREEEQREMDKRRREATKGIKLLTERDIHKVGAKLHEKQLREKEEEEKQKRITAKLKEKVEGHISKDPSRLTRPTKGWEERMKNVGPSGGGPSLQIFHRAVPTWRQAL